MSVWSNANRADLGPLLMRFALSGLLNGTVYAIAFLLVLHFLHFPSYAASIVGYLAGVVVGFILHRNFTFLAGGIWTWQLAKYLIAQAAVMSVISGLSYVASTTLEWPTYAVIGLGIGVAPVLTFALLNYWVFPHKSGLLA
jgi:putative flippase GtrA